MPKQPAKEQKLLVEVTRTWPLHNIKEVHIHIEGKDIWHNDITLDKMLSEELYDALADILNKNDGVHRD